MGVVYLIWVVYLLEECPIKRELGQRESTMHYNSKEKVIECTCIDNHYLWGTPKCEHFKGLREVIRGRRKVWRVFCDAVEIQNEK